jgi:hypothetical protein
MQRWPNLFIAGAPRCGTTSLHAWLGEIPGIFMSRIKEPNYFSRQVIADDHPLVKPIRDDAEYLHLFSGAGDARYLGEASPNYLEDPGAPEMIRQKSPGARILVSLRDPVERYHSAYLMIRNNRPSMGTVMEEIRSGIAGENEPSLPVVRPRVGLYSAQIERYRAVFGEGAFKVIVFEELMADPQGTLRQILGFLGIDHGPHPLATPAQRRFSEARWPVVRSLFGNRIVSRAAESLIPYKLRKRIRNAILVKEAPKPRMDAEARDFLVRYYCDDVARLESLLGRRMPWRHFGDDEMSRSAG